MVLLQEITFDVDKYLNEYYPRDFVSRENRILLNFYHEAYRHVKPTKEGRKTLMLDLGGGSTIYQLIAAAREVNEIHLSDYSDDSRERMSKWKHCQGDTDYWREYIHEALTIEQGTVTPEQITKRECLMRAKTSEIFKCDLRHTNPIQPRRGRERYDLVTMNFVAESITDNKRNWEQMVANACSLVRHQGLLFMATLRHATFWTVDGVRYPATYLRSGDIANVLEDNGFNTDIMPVKADEIDLNNKKFHGYDGFYLVKAQKIGNI